jgi:hypothetical protein
MKTGLDSLLRLVCPPKDTHGWIRTSDLCFRKALLYPLSYAGGCLPMDKKAVGQRKSIFHIRNLKRFVD